MDIDPLTLEHVARRRKTSTTLRVFSQRSFLVVPLRIVDLCKHALTSVPRFPTSKGLLVAVTDKRYFFSGHGRVLQSQDSHTCQLFTSLHFFCVWRVFLEIRVPILCFPSFSNALIGRMSPSSTARCLFHLFRQMPGSATKRPRGTERSNKRQDSGKHVG